jgi:hypothetical protein
MIFGEPNQIPAHWLVKPWRADMRETEFRGKRKYTSDELIYLLKEWAEKSGGNLSKRQLKECAGIPSDMTFRVAFGSWGNALKAAGLTVQRPYPSKQCLEAVSKAKKGKCRKKSSHWKGGKFITDQGYVVIWNTKLQKYELEHRIVIEEHLGRKLENWEDVHHINRVKNDNRIDNLEVLTKSAHAKLHEREDKTKHQRNSSPKRKKRIVYNIHDTPELLGQEETI